jgi:hypothetical protein
MTSFVLFTSILPQALPPESPSGPPLQAVCESVIRVASGAREDEKGAEDPSRLCGGATGTVARRVTILILYSHAIREAGVRVLDRPPIRTPALTRVETWSDSWEASREMVQVEMWRMRAGELFADDRPAVLRFRDGALLVLRPVRDGALAGDGLARPDRHRRRDVLAMSILREGQRGSHGSQRGDSRGVRGLRSRMRRSVARHVGRAARILRRLDGPDDCGDVVTIPIA